MLDVINSSVNISVGGGGGGGKKNPGFFLKKNNFLENYRVG